MQHFKTPKNESGFDQIWSDGEKLIVGQSINSEFQIYIDKEGITLYRNDIKGFCMRMTYEESRMKSAQFNNNSVNSPTMNAISNNLNSLLRDLKSKGLLSS